MKRFQINSFQILVLILLVLGVFFRFFNLDRKVYWNDEVYTSLRISGYTRAELVEQVGDRSISIHEIQKYQRVDPSKSLLDTIQALGKDGPHPPLYFALAKVWAEGIGDSTAKIRSFSVWISLLIFPTLYWLCLELFESAFVGTIAIAMIAVSPFHVLYAQEARHYSLLTVLVLLSSAALLWAIRSKNTLTWGNYFVAIALSLYCHFFAVFAIVSHGIYVAVVERFRWTKNTIAYLICLTTGLLSLIPWLVFILNDPPNAASFTAREIPVWMWLQRWLINLNSIVFDLQIGYHDRLFDVLSNQDLQLSLTNPLTYIAFLITGLITYSIYFLCRSSSQQIWLFVISLIGVTAAVLTLPDVISGGQRSTIGRYLIPCYLGLQLAIAYLFAKKLHQRLWKIIFAGMISLSVVSCVMSSQAIAWWNKYSSYYQPEVAAMINESSHSLTVSDESVRLMSLSYFLKPEAQLWLVGDPEKPKLPNTGHWFLLQPSRDLLERLQRNQNYQIELIHEKGGLWQITQNDRAEAVPPQKTPS